MDAKLAENYLNIAIEFIKKGEEKKAFQNLKQAYKYGNTQGYLLLADAYKNGRGTKEDLKQAFKITEELANIEELDNNVLVGQFNLSIMYAKGIGTEQDLDKFHIWIKKSADNGFTTAQHTYGYFLEKGMNGISVSLKEAEKYYIRACVKNHVDAQCNLVMLYANNEEFEDEIYTKKAIYWLKEATKNGHKQTAGILEQYKEELGDEFPSDEECEEAVSEDLDWAFQEAMESMLKLHNIDEEDDEVEQDEELVDEDELSDEDLTSYLVAKGFELMQKDGDYEGAFNHWKKAYEMGSITAAYNLAQCYDRGQGVKQNPQKGFELFLLCATSENADKSVLAGAQYRVGNGYFNGNGVERDFDKAFEWYTLAADNGNAFAQFNLALCYFTGNHLTINFKKCYHYASLAVENDFLQAYYILGTLYLSGNGVERDIVKAKELFTIAAERGDINSERILNQINFDEL